MLLHAEIILNQVSSNYIESFIRDIRNEVLNPINRHRKVILFLDPQTELGEFKFEYYNEHSDFKEIYGGISRDIFDTVIELFRWITASLEFSFMDYDTIDMIRKPYETIFLSNYLNTKKKLIIVTH